MQCRSNVIRGEFDSMHVCVRKCLSSLFFNHKTISNFRYKYYLLHRSLLWSNPSAQFPAIDCVVNAVKCIITLVHHLFNKDFTKLTDSIAEHILLWTVCSVFVFASSVQVFMRSHHLQCKIFYCRTSTKGFGFFPFWIMLEKVCIHPNECIHNFSSI